MEHGMEHQEHRRDGGINVRESVDTVSRDGVTVTARAPGVRHPECGAIPETPALIRPGNDVRQGPGRRWPKPASVAVLADGQAGPRWYCVEVQGGAEELAVGLVQALGFEAVVPKFLDVLPANPVRRLPAREVERPAFPGYVLVEFNRAVPGWQRIATVRGVRRVMGSDPERPSALRDVDAAWILGQFGEGGAQRVSRAGVKAAAPLAVGATVRVVAGPYEGTVGDVLESNGRAVVLMVAGWRVRLAQAAVEVCAAYAAP